MPQVSFRRPVTAALAALTACAFFAFAGTALAGTSGDLTYSVANDEVAITGCAGGAAACPATLAIPATIDGKPVTSIADSAFLDATDLTTVTIANSVTTIGTYAFARDYKLASVTLPTGLTSIGENIFRGATALSSVNIPEGVTTIGVGAFFNTQSLRSVTLPSSLKILGNASFQGSGLTSVAIPDGVESIGICAFMWNTSLKTVTIPKSVVSIGAEAFRGTFVLEAITFEGNAPSMGGNVFELSAVDAKAVISHSALTGFGAEGADFHGLVVHYALEVAYSIADGAVSITGCIGGAGGCQEVMVLPSTIEGLPVTKIAFGAFYTAWGVKSFTLPAGLTEINDYAFGVCQGITSITIPASVTRIGAHAFTAAIKLANVNFAGNAPALGEEPFDRIATGAKANLSNISQTGFGYNGDSFAGLVVTGGIDPPPYEFSVGSDSVTITGCRGGAAACPATLYIPSMIAGKPVTAVAGEAFYASPTLTGVTLPDSVTEIGNFAFYYTPLNRITLGSGLTTIGISAFAYTSLTSITIPASVTSIGAQAFAPASQLADVIFEGNAPVVATGAFDSGTAGATATLASPSLTGYGLNGDLFDALIVRGGVPKPPVIVGVPTEPTKSTSASFAFSGEEGASFKCSVDSSVYGACASPFAVRRLALGNHTIRIIQTGVNGAESAPASASWAVVELDAPSVAGKVGLKVNTATRVTTLKLKATADQSDQPNPVKWIEYFSHEKRPASSAPQNPKKIRQYGTTVVLPAHEVAFWVRVKDTKGKWSGWYWTKK